MCEQHLPVPDQPADPHGGRRAYRCSLRPGCHDPTGARLDRRRRLPPRELAVVAVVPHVELI
jgi:hypothetical protein